jgi:hypothetical protein
MSVAPCNGVVQFSGFAHGARDFASSRIAFPKAVLLRVFSRRRHSQFQPLPTRIVFGDFGSNLFGCRKVPLVARNVLPLSKARESSEAFDLFVFDSRVHDTRIARAGFISDAIEVDALARYLVR